jgi:tRNA(Ile)-lysidine synthase TilS/MesJ
MKTVVLAYSGGLDTSVCIPLLKERYDYDKVITVVADVGQLESKHVLEGGRNQHKDPRKGLAKDMCDKSSLDNLRIIGGEDDRMEEFGSERGCERSRFGYTTSGDIALS